MFRPKATDAAIMKMNYVPRRWMLMPPSFGADSSRVRSSWGPALAIVLLVLAISGCAFPTQQASPEAPLTPAPRLPLADEVAFAFLQAWEQGDYPLMYSLLSPASQETFSEELFTTTYEQVVAEAEILSVTPRILAAYQPDTQANVAFETVYHTAQFGSLEVQNQMPLSFVEGRWGVDWSPGLLFPQMSAQTYVRRTTWVPSRGNIYDRNGLGLAVQGELVEIGVVPREIEDEAAVLDQLSVVLEQSPAELKARYKDTDPDWYVPLGRIGSEVGRTYYDMLVATPGVELRTAWTRSYRTEVIAPHVVGVVGPVPREELELWRAQGYSGDEIVGWMGLERWGEPYLAGKPGGQLEVVTAQGESLAVLAEEPSQESSSVYTTFDRQFQQQVQDILGQRTGAIAVLEANTGRVLALATYPTFDPNSFATGIGELEWSNLEQDPRHPLVNRATQGVYPAGSVFKIVTMAAGMEAGALTADSPFVCNGIWTGLGADLPKVCWLRSGHGQIGLAKALTVSCDITFYQVGLVLNALDPEILPDYARRFGFGSPTGIEIEEHAGLVPDPTWKMQVKGEGWSPGDSVNLAIGQSELLVSPLQIAAMLAAVGNGGTLYRPSLVEMVAAEPGNPDWTFAPVALAEIPVGSENLAVIQNSLHRVTAAPDGTAHEAFQGFGYSVAGKTGTAESGQGEPHAWFAGYAPAQDPQIAIAVLLERGGPGGEQAAPLLRQVVGAYFGSTQKPEVTAPPAATELTPTP
jgi:penicillin-binding protein 2